MVVYVVSNADTGHFNHNKMLIFRRVWLQRISFSKDQEFTFVLRLIFIKLTSKVRHRYSIDDT